MPRRPTRVAFFAAFAVFLRFFAMLASRLISEWHEFETMALEEFELRALERQIDEIRSRVLTAKKAVWESFRAASDKTQKRE
jgi:hypothetical protein